MSKRIPRGDPFTRFERVLERLTLIVMFLALMFVVTNAAYADEAAIRSLERTLVHQWNTDYIVKRIADRTSYIKSDHKYEPPDIPTSPMMERIKKRIANGENPWLP